MTGPRYLFRVDAALAFSAAAEVESYLRALLHDPLVSFRGSDGPGTDTRMMLVVPADRDGVRGPATIRAHSISDLVRSFETLRDPYSEAESGTPECPGEVTWEVPS